MTLRKLENFTLADIDEVTAHRQAMIAEAIDARDRWERAVARVRLLLEANPDWTWRDAVDHMRDIGALDEIPS